jgi:hypothetical protein
MGEVSWVAPGIAIRRKGLVTAVFVRVMSAHVTTNLPIVLSHHKPFVEPLMIQDFPHAPSVMVLPRIRTDTVFALLLLLP